MFSKFYSWYDRVKVSPATGLQLAYTGADILLTNGTVFTLAPGVLNLPAISTVKVYINESGQVSSGSDFPNTCIPLAIVTTGPSEITNVQDLRYKVLEQMTPIRLPAAASPFIVGEIRPYAGYTAPPGWLLAQGQTLSRNDYPALFAVLGYNYGGSGDSFRLPDLRGRTLVGAGQGSGLENYTVAQTGGLEKVRLDVGQLPTHSHGVNDSGHTHGVNDSGHSHETFDPGHVHGINDPGHIHTSTYKRTVIPGVFGDNGAELSQAQIVAPRYGQIMNPAQTGISIGLSASGVSVNNASSRVSVGTGTTNISVNNAGGNGVHENRQPYLVVNYLIKT